MTNSASEKCKLGSKQLSLSVNDTHFKNTHILQLRFKNITNQCNYNYTLQLKVSSHSYFTETPFVKPTNPSLFYNLNVQTPIKPYFINKQSNMTLEIFNSSQTANETILVTTADIKVESDKTIELNCQAFGRPKPTIIWLKDGKLVNITDEKYKVSEGSLKVFRTHPVDSGLYECRVENRYGAISRSFNVQVEATNVKRVQKQRMIIRVVSISLTIVIIFLVVALLLFYFQRKENNKIKVNNFCC